MGVGPASPHWMPQLPHTRLEGSGLPHMGHSRTDWSETDPKEEIFMGALEGGWTTVGGAVGAAEAGVGSTGAAALAEASVVEVGEAARAVGEEEVVRAGSAAEGAGGIGTEKGSAGGVEGAREAAGPTSVGRVDPCELEGAAAAPAVEGPPSRDRSSARMPEVSNVEEEEAEAAAEEEDPA